MLEGAKLLGLMRHAVGLDSKRAAGYRNNYATEQSDPDWLFLCDIGLAVTGRKIPGGLQMFHVSKAGVAMLRVLHPGKLRKDLKGGV